MARRRSRTIAYLRVSTADQNLEKNKAGILPWPITKTWDGCGLWKKRSPVRSRGEGQWQLDGSMQSKIIAMAFTVVAEIERDLISHRTKEALRAKKAAGVKLGRPRGPGKSKLDPYQPEIEALLANGSTQRFIAQRYGTTEANLYHWLTKRGLKLVKGAAPIR